MKKLFTLFLFALLAITSAWAADELYYTLQCKNNSKNTDYADNYDVTINGMNWNAPGNQNPPTSVDVWRIGGKSIDKVDRTITGKSPMNAEISKITIYHNGFGGTGTPTLNHVKVIVGSDASFSTTIDEVTVTPNISASGSFDISPTEGKTWTSGSFYKIIFNLTKTTSKNAGLDLTKIEFFKSATSTTPGKTATSLSFGADWDGKTITKYIGDEDILNCPATLTPAVENATITYSSSDTKVAIIDENGDILLGDAVGKTTIKASYAGDETHEASYASFTIDLQKLPDPTFSPAPGAVVAGTEVTITAPTNCTISYYVNDGAVQSSTTNTVTLTINEATTIVACSKYQGAVNTIEGDLVYASYTINEFTGDTYTLVTSTKDLVDGAKYVLLTADGTKAASTWNSSKNKITTVGDVGTSFTLNGTVVTTSGTSVNVLTLAQTKLGWTITDQDNNSFSSASSTDISSNNSSGTFAISVDTDGTVKIVGSDANRLWLFSSSNGVIGNYSKNNATANGYSKLKLYKSNSAVVVKPDAPTFDPVSGAAFDTETATVTITAPEGCTLKYTVGSGAEQTSSSNTAEVTVSPTAYTITAKSVDAKGVESNEATATYTFNVVAHVKNIAEFLALPDKTTAIFDNPVVVLYDYSQPSLKKTDGQYLSNPEYIWVKDESGQTNLYLEEAINPTNHQAKYENGDVIPAGFKAVKNYFSDGNFYQALVDIDNKSLLADASHKRLADPVTITFDEFNALQVGSDAHIAKWNNTYVMIPKVTMAADASDKWGKTYFVYQDGVKATSNVFYNKYSDLRDEEYALTKQGEDARVTMPTSSTKEYNVYGILQVYNNIWEIMPIRFVEYSAQTLTLKELVELGKANSTTSTTEYTILNDLRGVRALTGNVILAKDENGNAVDKVTPAGNSFMINAKSKFDDAATEESVNATAQEDYDQSNWVEIVLPSSVSAADYVDKIITGMTVKGNYTDTTNPRLEASAAPTAGGPTGAYTRNAMCPANFMGTSQACNAEQNHGDFFFMTPKPNECVQVVWAVYNSTADAFYIPKAEGSINSHGFKGAFSIDWAYNADGEITNLTEGGLYQFAAVVKEIEPGPQSPKRKIAYDNGQPLSSDYVVYPLNLDANTVTGITETTGAKTVKSVRYFNIMGVELAEPTAGVNIVLTTYTDGTTHSQKILK